MASISEQVAQAARGEHPRFVARLPSGILLLGDTQPLPGYCVLVADPVVPSLNDLRGESRDQFLRDMALVGDGLLEAFGALRINYEMWGNLDPTLHTHIVPRYTSEAAELRVLPPRLAYDWGNARAFDAAKDQATILKIRTALGK